MFLICYMHFYHMYPIMKCLMSFKNWLPSFFCAFILWLSEILIRKWFSWIRLLLVHLASWSVSLHQSLAINTYAGFIIGIKIGKLRHKHFFLLIFFLLVKLFQAHAIEEVLEYTRIMQNEKLWSMLTQQSLEECRCAR
jgi:hypothetical protein